MKTRGRCLCRAVTFEFEGEPKWVLNCHCEDCRRATSAPMATWVSVVEKNGLRFTGAQPTYFASSEGVRRGFCGRCGSPLTYEHDQMPGEVHLLAVALEDPSGLKPQAHIFTVDQLAWFDAADDLPRYLHTRRDAQPTRHGPRNNRTKG
jgi:hypothetical protein